MDKYVCTGRAAPCPMVEAEVPPNKEVPPEVEKK